MLLEADLDPHADRDRVGVDVDQIRDDADSRILFDSDGGDDEGRGEAGVPQLVVDGDAHHHPTTGNLRNADVF